MKITATKLHRHMLCNGSSKMNEPEFEPEVQNTKPRDEGVAADWIIEQVSLGNYQAVDMVNLKAPNGVFITAEMINYLQEYLSSLGGFAVEVNTDWNNSLNMVITGRADRIKYDAAAKHLYVDDFKYGYSIVEPKNNWTLISHAIGWYIQNKNLYESNGKEAPVIDFITFGIYQPRAKHFEGGIRKHTIDFKELLSCIEQIVEAFDNPKDELVTGQHCYKCPHVVKCPASRKAENNSIDATEKLFNEKIKNDELDYELDHLERAIKILSQRKEAYEELAVARLKRGQIINNRSLDTQLANTSWKKHVTPEGVFALTGKDVSKKSLVTPAQAKNVYGVPEEIIAPLTERAVKGVKMVRIDADTKAQKIFNQK